MSEHSVLKHGIKSYKIWRNPNTTWRSKTKDILIEILIIIFAVIITLYLERVREHKELDKIKIEFLKGYRSDLISDLTELKNDSLNYHKIQLTLIRLLKKEIPKDSLASLASFTLQTIDFLPSTGRFEALKAAGKLNAINNTELLNIIFELYQKDIPYLKLFGSSRLIEFKDNIISPHLYNKFKLNKKYDVTNWDQLMETDIMKLFFYKILSSTFEIETRYHIVIKKHEQILELIDKELE